MGKTLFDKIWDSHVITDLGNGFVAAAHRSLAAP